MLYAAYNKVSREALWNILNIYGVKGQLLEGIKAFYREASACVRVWENESFAVGIEKDRDV